MHEANTEMTAVQDMNTDKTRCVGGVCMIDPSFMERLRKAQAHSKEVQGIPSADGLAA